MLNVWLRSLWLLGSQGCQHWGGPIVLSPALRPGAKTPHVGPFLVMAHKKYSCILAGYLLECHHFVYFLTVLYACLKFHYHIHQTSGETCSWTLQTHRSPKPENKGRRQPPLKSRQQFAFCKRLDTGRKGAGNLMLYHAWSDQRLRDLEQEIGISIFIRTNRGIYVSSEGKEFLCYALQIIEQENILKEHYLGAKPSKKDEILLHRYKIQIEIILWI